MKAAATALVLAGLASSTSVVKVAPPTGGYTLSDSEVQPGVTTRAGTYTVISEPKTPAVEHLPNSQLSWEFDREADGTAAIKGPSGTIWRGNLSVGMGPITPYRSQPDVPGYRIIDPGLGTEVPRSFQFALPPGKAAPQLPNLSPILPPGQMKPPDVVPKATP